MNNYLYNFTRAISSAVAFFRAAVKSILPNLYIINQQESTENTPLIYSGDYPNINPQAYGEYLDLLGSMFDLYRNNRESDSEFRTRILFFISENVTKEGISRSIKQIFMVNNIEVDVDIRENYTNFFDGTSTSLGIPLRSSRHSLLYGITVVISPVVESINSVNIFNYSTLQKEMINFPVGTTWRVRRNPYTSSIINSFRIESLRYLIDDISAAGIKVDSVIVKSFGTSGSNSPVKHIEKPVGYLSGIGGESELPENVLIYDDLPLIYDGEFLVL